MNNVIPLKSILLQVSCASLLVLSYFYISRDGQISQVQLISPSPVNCETQTIVVPQPPVELEPFCISLEPTHSYVSCNIILKLTSSLSGYLEGEGNCHGFVGTVILINGQDDRQLAHLSPPNQILWAHEMEGIERALVTVYENVLHHELLDAAHWVESPDVEYIPNITLRTASVIQAADFTENSLDNLPTNDEKAGIDPFSSFNQIWASKTFGNWSRDLDLSCVTGPNAEQTSSSRNFTCSAVKNCFSISSSHEYLKAFM